MRTLVKWKRSTIVLITLGLMVVFLLMRSFAPEWSTICILSTFLIMLPLWILGRKQGEFRGSLELGMSQETVRKQMGKPTEVDMVERTATGIEKERWVYGQKRKSVAYLYFRDGELYKIDTTGADVSKKRS